MRLSFQRFAVAFTLTWCLLLSAVNWAHASTFAVINTNESGSGSLREAITLANASSDQSDITFNLGAGSRTITLASALPDLSSNLSITGPLSGLAVARAANNPLIFRIFNVTGGKVGLTNLLILGGDAGTSGGGGINNSGGTLTVSRCTLAGNFASGGGAVFSSTSSDLTTGFTVLRNCTLANNTSTGSNGGGGVYNYNGKTVLDSCTVVGNQTPSGTAAGVFSYADSSTRIEIGNTIIAGNLTNDDTPASNTDVRLSGSVAANFFSTGYNLIGDGDAMARAQFSKTGDRIDVADDALKLGTLSNNSGPTPTIALLNGSPAINTGNTALTTDQRGVARPQAGAADIGAFELANPMFTPSLIVTTLADENNATSDPTIGDGTSLREAIDYANSNSDQSTITFNLTGSANTINLQAALPNLDSNIAITGTGAHVLTVQRQNGGNYSVFTVNSGKTVNLSGLTITGGNAVGSDSVANTGGGIFNSGGNLSISACAIIGNTAGAVGGGVAAPLGGTTTIIDSTISSNTAGNAGGALDVQDGSMSLVNCTVSGNTANGQGTGGAISNFARNASSTLTLSNCTVAGNTGSNADGIIFNYANATSVATVAVANTLVADNNGPNFVNFNNAVTGSGSVTLTSNGYNLSDDATGPNTSTDKINTNPLLELDSSNKPKLFDNGGPTPTIALQANSPAINAGNTTLEFDQRGIARPQGARDDIGAFENLVLNNAPVNGTVTPNAAVNAPGTVRSFTATYSDAQGADDINLVALRVGGSGNNSTNSLLCLYNPATDTLSLYNDAANAFVGSAPRGSNAVLSNSQGSLNCHDVTASKNGDVMTVNWNLSATGAFAGTKQSVFLFARDTKNLTANYKAKGSWTINSNVHPTNLSVNPVNVSDAPNIERVFTTTFSDPNGYKNLLYVTLRLGGSGTGTTTNNAGAMLCVYNVQLGKLYFFNDQGSYVPMSDFPGRPTVLSNSQGSLDCAKTTVTGSGNTLTVKWSVKANATFAGARGIALLCSDRGSLRDGYDTFGKWTITSASGAPASGAPASAGLSTAKAAQQSISLVFTGVAPQSGYGVTVNGANVEVTRADVQGSKVGLTMLQPLVSGDQVVVTWPQGSKTFTAN